MLVGLGVVAGAAGTKFVAEEALSETFAVHL